MIEAHRLWKPIHEVLLIKIMKGFFNLLQGCFHLLKQKLLYQLYDWNYNPQPYGVIGFYPKPIWPAILIWSFWRQFHSLWVWFRVELTLNVSGSDWFSVGFWLCRVAFELTRFFFNENPGYFSNEKTTTFQFEY